jgi:phosphate transport system permease protein
MQNKTSKKKKRDKSKLDKNTLLKKKFRFSEVLAEKIITLVAFLSIAIVILIFLFVFRETLPIFNSGSEKEITKSDNQSELSDKKGEGKQDLKPESYSSETTELKPETYGEDSTQLSSKDSNSIAEVNYSERETTPQVIAYKTFTSTKWLPVSDNPRYGFLPLIIGTLKVTLISILFAAPLAILAALYTSVFASRRMREIIKPTIEVLASFPSVVIGFFALMVMASFLQQVFGYDSRLNSFVGGIAMGLAAIPVIYTITEDALSAVPKSYSEASLALGANKWQTAFYVILPAATPGIFAAMLLGIGRVFGETMIALMATGNAALISANPFDSVRTLSATIGAEMAEVVFGDTHYSVLFLIGSLLFIFTFMLNAVAEFYIKGKLMKRIQGK